MQRTECIKPDDLLRSRNRPQQNITLTGEAGRFKVEYDKKLLSPATDTVELTDPKLIHSWKRKKLTRIRFTIVSQQISGESKLVIRKVQYHKTLND